MNKEEATKFLVLVKVAYPSSYKNIDDITAEATVNMWHQTFADVPYAIMEMAFDHFRRISTFAPTVADICNELKGLYYAALSDVMTTTTQSKVKIDNYIMEHTSRFREGAGRYYEINYNSLARLVGTKEALLLEEG